MSRLKRGLSSLSEMISHCCHRVNQLFCFVFERWSPQHTQSISVKILPQGASPILPPITSVRRVLSAILGCWFGPDSDRDSLAWSCWSHITPSMTSHSRRLQGQFDASRGGVSNCFPHYIYTMGMIVPSLLIFTLPFDRNYPCEKDWGNGPLFSVQLCFSNFVAW